MARFRTDLSACVFFFCLCLIVFSRGLDIHGLEYRDDEIFYYHAVGEMVDSGDYLSPTYFGKDRFQKPILFYWFVLLCGKIFGFNWSGMRMTAVIFAGLTVCVTWLMARLLFDRKTASLSAVILMSVPLFFRHAKNIVPDMALNFFIVGAMYCAIRHLDIVFNAFNQSRAAKESPSKKFWWLFYVACGCGFMVKGFMALLAPIGTIVLFSLCTRQWRILREMRFLRGLTVISVIAVPWFLFMIATHGMSYLDYMIVNETKDRLIVENEGPAVLGFVRTFLDHAVYYLSVLGNYFAPWSLFLIGALPFAARRSFGKEANRPLLFLLLWFLLVYCFFSSIYFTINHYMLVLSTPFAIMISAFCLKGLERGHSNNDPWFILRKVYPSIVFLIGGMAYVFLAVFLAGYSMFWLPLITVFLMAVLVYLFKSKSLLSAPLSLGILIIFVFAQSSMMGRAGVTAHAALQKFAETIHHEMNNRGERVAIAAGSHDIHEKEFQVYFDQRVLKAAGSDDDYTQSRLEELFNTDKIVYCLITEVDYKKFIENHYNPPIEILQEDYIVRRRMYIDRNFFVALLRLDQERVHDYIKEKLVLVKKE